MKPFLTRFVTVLLLTVLYQAATAQLTYTISTNTNSSVFGSGVICSNCDIIISPGVTLTINSTCSCNNCTFSGGTINLIPGSNFTLTGVDSFKNDTVFFNQTVNSQTLTFYGDSVAFNTPVTLPNGPTNIDSSHVSVNAALTLKTSTIKLDTLHLNSNLTLSNSPDSFSNSHVDVASGVTISTNQTQFTNSTFAFAGSSSMTVNNNMTSTGSNFYLGGTSTISSNSATTLTTSKVVMTGTNKFTAGNALPVTGSDITVDAGSTLTASSLTVTGGAISNSGTITSSNAITLTGDTLTMAGTSTMTGSQFSVTSGSVAMSGTASVSSSNAVSYTNTLVTMSGSASVTGSTASITGTSMTEAGSASLTSGNGLVISGSNVTLDGNSTQSGSTVTIENNSYYLVGDGSTNSAHLISTNQLQVLDTSTLAISNNNNYFQTNAANFTGGTTTYLLTPTTGSCGGAGENACTLGKVYGCATLNKSGAVACSVLAIADVNLTAITAGADAVALSWTDARSSAAGDYIIQRSVGNADWTTIATMDATASDNGDYHFEDRNAPAGTVDYRIVRMDQDGNASYSTVCTVTIAQTANTVGIYPNPVSGRIFYITVPGTEQLIVSIFTLTGQLAMRTTLQGQTQYSVELPSQLLPGTAVIVQTIRAEQRLSFPLLLR